ncbi:MAG: formylglycine-generating enzyme family protein [Proteobacteria bacterium]|nr:formylglycine-generating enzyme family protein [Pseudomonadota bacterium]MBU1688365.1 formylglycine-generating enzyme family protein [Pseudomonadota bacterium]
MVSVLFLLMVLLLVIDSVQAEEVVFGGNELVLVTGGCFQMGDLYGDGFVDELPVHKVCLDDFYLGKFEVTQWQWQTVMDGENPARFKKGGDYPVERVSWEDSRIFIRELSRLTGYAFRLPTEAEWEYACRSGGKIQKYCGGDSLESVGHYRNNSGYSTHPVGVLKPNSLGIYDMSGNVWEWVQDYYVKDYFNRTGQNPQGPENGVFRVSRGGSWDYDPLFARASARNRSWPDKGFFSLGFRLALSKSDAEGVNEPTLGIVDEGSITPPQQSIDKLPLIKAPR